jgi:methionyl-tRNA synthetase
MKKRLVTSALPYVNNIPHLGNLVQVLSADCFARFCRSKGYETLYICGTDEYGTASETRALQEGVSPQELCDRYHVIHRDIYRWFEIDFDHFGRTSSPQQTEIVQDIFKKVDAAGYIRPAEIEQLYCEHDHRFLADRFVEGTCPKCGSPGARGDQCDACGTLLDPTDLIDPVCGVCHNTPVLKQTKHLYIDLPKALPLLETWLNQASVDGFWARNAIQTTRSWIRDGLKERAITRDLKWGIPVPKPGYEDKVFYVWFDAPIGYISITASYTDQWKQWWHNPDDVELFQFIGKDNIPFHTVIFPTTLLATGEQWTMLHHMSSSEYLNYEGGKFSKSKGIGVFGNDVQETGIPADMWRFYMFYNRPEKADVLFTWKDFQEKVNGELIGNLSNLINRTLTFIQRFYDGKIPEGTIDRNLAKEIIAKEAEIDHLLEHAELREALRRIFALSSLGNKAFQDGEPWKTRKEQPQEAANLLRTLVYLIRDLGILIQPYMPQASSRLLGFLGSNQARWHDLGSFTGITELSTPDYLFTKLEDALIETLRTRYAGSQESRQEEKQRMEEQQEKVVSPAELFTQKVTLRVSKIIDIQRHPNGDKLYIIQVDTGAEDPVTIVSSIVPYYTEEQLLNRNIVLVENLKPANFRGVKSRGMLLAASRRGDETHETCEVLFADQFTVGSELLPQGYERPEQARSQVKADQFFALRMYTEHGVVKIDGHPIEHEGTPLEAHTYVDGEVG